MEYNQIDVDGLIIKVPIIQGGMGIGVSLSNLAGNVSKLGGLGVISAAQIGFREPDFITNNLEANLRALKKEIITAKEISNNSPIGVNIMQVTNPYELYVKTCIEAGADFIITGAGLPVHLPEYVAGSKMRIAPILSSFKAVKIFLKAWDKRYNTTADMLVVEGPLAGGHLGFSRDAIVSTNMDLELEQILEHIKIYREKYNKKIPVIFGGGVYTNEDMKYYMQKGIDGVQIGSRFVTTKECDAHENFKQAYISAQNEEDIVVINSPVGLPGRAINNNFVKKVIVEREKITRCFNCLTACDPKTTPYCITQALVNSVTGDIDNGLIFAGSKSYKSSKIETVKEVFDDLLR